MLPILVVVVPCYNEEKVLPITSKLFLNSLMELIAKNKVANTSKILFVDDGSSDSTWKIIKTLSEQNSHFIGIAQSRNRGHQSSVLAGLMEVSSFCDITISIDCDGQDDISAMEKMIDAFNEGAEIVYGVRSSRVTDTFFKRFTAESFYKLLKLMGADIEYNHADYRLVSSRVLQAFYDFKEVNLFLRGMFPLVGFKSTHVYYERHERLAGESHYPLHKMLALAFDGITSLSIRPIRIITLIGVASALLSFLGVIWTVTERLVGDAVSGWASTLAILCFIGSIQLVSLGVIGEYVGKTYLETKRRPRYIICDRTYELKNGMIQRK